MDCMKNFNNSSHLPIICIFSICLVCMCVYVRIYYIHTFIYIFNLFSMNKIFFLYNQSLIINTRICNVLYTIFNVQSVFSLNQLC